MRQFKRLTILLVMLLLFSSFISAQTLNLTGNIQYNSFDDADRTGNNVDDLTGNGNNISAQNGVLFTGNGHFLNGTDYDLSDDYMAGNLNGYAFEAFTFSVWSKTTHPIVGQLTLFGSNGATNSLYCAYFLDAGVGINCWIDIANSLEENVQFKDASVNNGSWQHYAFTYDGNTDGYFKIYWNGNNIINSSGTTSNIFTLNFPMDLGRRNEASPTAYLNGSLDDFSVWNRSLSASEIQILYNLIQNPYVDNFPNITVVPPNATLEFNVDSLNVIFEAETISGIIDTWSINDTTNFKITTNGNNGTLENATNLSVGMYYINVSVNNTLGFSDSVIYQVDVKLDISPPVMFNFSDNSTATTPEIGDTITLSATVTDDFIIDTCELEIYNPLIDTWQINSSYFINVSTQVNLDTFYTVPSYYTTNSTVYWRLTCNDSFNNVNTSINQSFTVKDTTLPSITLCHNNTFKLTNDTVVSNELYNMTVCMNTFDYNLFQASINVTCDISGQIFYTENISIVNTTNITLSGIVNMTGLPLQKCTAVYSSSDSHTDEEYIEDMYDITGEGIVISSYGIETYIMSKDNDMYDIDTTRKTDRRSMLFQYDNKALKRSYDVISDHPLYLISEEVEEYDLDGAKKDNKEKDKNNRGYNKKDNDRKAKIDKNKKDGIGNYPAHLVAWNNNQKQGQWIDFDEIGNLEVEKKYTTRKISDYHYEIDVEVLLPTNIDSIELEPKRKWFFGPLMTRDELILEYYGLEDVNLNSIGGTNVENLSVEGYIGGVINITGLNIFDNTTFGNFNFTLTTINSFPGLNITNQNVPTTSYIIENVSNGTYQLDFTSEQYFSKTNNFDVTSSLVYQNFSSSQAQINFIVRNVVTGNEINGTNITIELDSTSITRTITNGINPISFSINISDWNYTATLVNYDTFTDIFSVGYKENLTITIDMSVLSTVFLIDEITLSAFNVSSPDLITMLIFCEDSTDTIFISSNTSIIPISCPYEKFKFVLDYDSAVSETGLTSYYRTLLIPYADVFNVSVFLIDLATTTEIFNSLIVDDLLNEYDNPKIVVTKRIGTIEEQITGDFVDIENKIGAYLVSSHEYNVYVHSDNNPIRFMGPYSADLTGEKVLRLYDINIDSDTDGVGDVKIYTSVTTFNISKQNLPDVNATDEFAITTYNDINNLTTSVTWNLYQDRYNGTLITTSTINDQATISQGLEFTYNITSLGNVTLVSEIIFVRSSITQKYIKTIKVFTEIVLDVFAYVDQEFLNWMFTILLSIIAIYATVRTGNMVALALIGFAALFVMFGWFTMSIGILALSALIALIAVLKEGAERRIQ